MRSLEAGARSRSLLTSEAVAWCKAAPRTEGLEAWGRMAHIAMEEARSVVERKVLVAVVRRKLVVLVAVEACSVIACRAQVAGVRRKLVVQAEA